MVAVRVLDHADLAAVYRDHARAVYGLARRMCGPTLAEEVTQEVFLCHWRHPERFDPSRSSLRGFLLTITHRRAIDTIRSESSRRRRENHSARGRPEVSREADHQLVEQERSADIIKAISELSPLERDAVVSAYYGDRTYREVAVLLGMPLGTIKSRIRSALAKLRCALGELPLQAHDEAA